MSAILTETSLEHDGRLARHLDAMPPVGDMVGQAAAADLRPRVDDMSDFLERLLLPHMDAAERTLYPELERLLQNRHSMAPMRRDHDEIRQLIAGISVIRQHLDASALDIAESSALRRLIFRLFAMLKVHLAEERLYLSIIEQGASEEELVRLAAAMEHSGITAF